MRGQEFRCLDNFVNNTMVPRRRYQVGVMPKDRRPGNTLKRLLFRRQPHGLALGLGFNFGSFRRRREFGFVGANSPLRRLANIWLFGPRYLWIELGDFVPFGVADYHLAL